MWWFCLYGFCLFASLCSLLPSLDGLIITHTNVCVNRKDKEFQNIFALCQWHGALLLANHDGGVTIKAWARAFYESPNWRATSTAYLRHAGGMCERCSTDRYPVPATICHHKKYLTPSNISDPRITLNYDNLEALCMDCHNKEHKRIIDRRYRFDQGGRVLPPQSCVKNGAYHDRDHS